MENLLRKSCSAITWLQRLLASLPVRNLAFFFSGKFHQKVSTGQVMKSFFWKRKIPKSRLSLKLDRWVLEDAKNYRFCWSFSFKLHRGVSILRAGLEIKAWFSPDRALSENKSPLTSSIDKWHSLILLRKMKSNHWFVRLKWLKPYFTWSRKLSRFLIHDNPYGLG